MTTEEIEQRLVEGVFDYVDAARRLRLASLEESEARRSALNVADLMKYVSKRAYVESEACDAEALLFSLCDALAKARKCEREANRLREGA